MIDFLMIATRTKTVRRRDVIEIYPKFIIKKSSDLMIRGSDFYAIWLDSIGLWSTDEQDAIQLIDRELDRYYEENKAKFDCPVHIQHLWDAESGMIDSWHRYCQKQMRDNYHMLDEKLIFSNNKPNKKDYASKRLDYALENGDCPAYEKLISTLYSPEERHKIEWAIGSIVSGASKKIQKFIVLYGAFGTGKSTILNIIEALFAGYFAVFDAKALGQANAQFALEPFKTNPLVAIQHDGDLSRIEDNTRLNSLVSHEKMTVNEKFKSAYTNDFKAFLFMATNKPVKITDAKSGLLRRLIDVTPSGNKVDKDEYDQLKEQVKYELGAIAYYCRQVYLDDPNCYDDYVPVSMMGATNDFYNFVADNLFIFEEEDGVTLKRAYELYKTYCEEAKVPYPLSRMIFKEELKNYFYEYEERKYLDDGTRVRCYYSGFRRDKMDIVDQDTVKKKKTKKRKFVFEEQESIFDKIFADCPAQLASKTEKPTGSWDKVTTKLSDIDTHKVHYVNIPAEMNHIVIDFDLKDEEGNKSFERNLEEAEKWPITYAELSKSEAGIHLHYNYAGDASKLMLYFEDKPNVEIKVFNGNASLRRKLTKCNNHDIATISSGLPMKGEKMVDADSIKNEDHLRAKINKALRKEVHSSTKCNIDYIYKVLNDAYESGMTYDVSNLKTAVLTFAEKSTNNAQYCDKLVSKMHFKSDAPHESVKDKNELPIIFFDCEVFPNLFILNWKYPGKENKCVRMINPSVDEVDILFRTHRPIGFNCRRYDNHICYGRMMGMSNEQLYLLSKAIIDNRDNVLFGNAYNLSYTDIYDFASAGNKKSLKKLEIEMGIHHQELGLDWNQPVPEELWVKVAEYCDNDVEATEAAFDYLQEDWIARQILAELAGMSVNDTTNNLTAKIIFGDNRNPQSEFHYRDLSQPIFDLDEETRNFLAEACPEMMSQTHGAAGSLLPYFDGYEYKNGKSIFMGEEVGEGGYVYAEPGIHTNVYLLDIASMHPHSAIAECLFGVRYTKAYRDIVEGRVSIKHEAWDIVNNMLDGKLKPFVQMVIDGKITSKGLANALKTAINAVYGLTAAKFINPFRDKRNLDNIVAKRGALFMVELKNEVQKRGFTVAHIKTDSIKIPNATQEIVDFVMEFGKKYGYTFELEDIYEKMCLVNDAVYIAKYKEPHKDKKTGKDIWWTATGKEFAIPYTFKKLFTKEQIEFNDLCETFAVSKGNLYLDLNEDLPQLDDEELKELELLNKFMDICSDPEHDHEDVQKIIAKYARKYSPGMNVTEEILFDRIAYLKDCEEKSHNYVFVGRVGQFTPVKDGCGGGYLYRMQDDKYYAAPGSSGYRWVESEYLRENHREDDVNLAYFNKLATDSAESIIAYGDITWFTE